MDFPVNFIQFHQHNLIHTSLIFQGTCYSLHPYYKNFSIPWHWLKQKLINCYFFIHVTLIYHRRVEQFPLKNFFYFLIKLLHYFIYPINKSQITNNYAVKLTSSPKWNLIIYNIIKKIKMWTQNLQARSQHIPACVSSIRGAALHQLPATAGTSRLSWKPEWG